MQEVGSYMTRVHGIATESTCRHMHVGLFHGPNTDLLTLQSLGEPNALIINLDKPLLVLLHRCEAGLETTKLDLGDHISGSALLQLSNPKLLALAPRLVDHADLSFGSGQFPPFGRL